MRSLVFVFSFLLAISANAQFQLVGSTSNLGGGVYQMTPDVLNVSGSMWYKVQHDLNKPFNVQGQMNFGTKDPLGADGMVFVMQTSCLSAGGGGGGLGFSGIPGQSLGIEFDTYQNISGTGAELNNDPTFDHIAVEINGDVVHDGSANDITAPVQIDAGSPDVETGIWYDFQINYNPTTKVLTVIFNGSTRVNIVYDLKATVFSGKQYVYWGFTSTTGGSSNLQQISLNSTLTTHVIQDTTICTGSIPVVLPSLASLRGTNLALNNPVFASSSSDGGPNILQAVDGNLGSRWESVWNVDPQWIYVDLQSPTDIDSVVLYWEAARAKDYQIQTSTDAVTWTTVFSTTTGSGPKDQIIFSATNIRYVRMYGTARLIGYGYSIWEFQIYGQPKYLWSTNNGTNATITPDIYSSSVTLSPAATATYSVLIPDPCMGFATLSTTVTVNCPAPVELISFTAKSEEQGVHLQWTTASEQNSNYFEILKSIDGMNFHTIGTLSASGNSSNIITYNFLDKEIYNGTEYYKIVTVDKDGSKQSSEIETIQNETKKAVVLSPVFESETSILLSGKVDYIQYSIYDMMGREVSNVSNANPADNISIGQYLAPACYLLKLRTNIYSETIKICKVR